MPLKSDDLKNRDTFSRYIYNLHELVNKMLKKKSGLTYADVRKRYEHFRARCGAAPPVKKWTRKAIRRGAKAMLKHTSKTKTKTNIKGGKEKEKGCTEPLYAGQKAKCIIKIVPQEERGDTFQMDSKCEKKRLTPD